MARKSAETFTRVSITDGSVLLLKSKKSAAQIAEELHRKGFIETIVVADTEDEGTSLVLMKSAVLLLSPYTRSFIETGIVKITSVPSKMRN